MCILIVYFFNWMSPDRQIVTSVSFFSCSWLTEDIQTLTVFDGWTHFIHLSSLIEISDVFNSDFQKAKKKSALSLSSVLSFCDTKRFVLLSLLKLHGCHVGLHSLCSASCVHYQWRTRLLVYVLSLIFPYCLVLFQFCKGGISDKISSWNYSVWPTVLINDV